MTSGDQRLTLCDGTVLKVSRKYRAAVIMRLTKHARRDTFAGSQMKAVFAYSHYRQIAVVKSQSVFLERDPAPRDREWRRAAWKRFLPDGLDRQMELREQYCIQHAGQAVLAPIPKASVMIAIAANPGPLFGDLSWPMDTRHQWRHVVVVHLSQ
jgi:hypothetical protein